ncbi:hypothetical protein BV20DRAFT_969742 [Pilatotrama ljubarskyi]|nr:hypothetical protein BV20DRAFT_969742 [Pilatotrama ljubarskyi]
MVFRPAAQNQTALFTASCSDGLAGRSTLLVSVSCCFNPFAGVLVLGMQSRAMPAPGQTDRGRVRSSPARLHTAQWHIQIALTREGRGVKGLTPACSVRSW